MTDSFRKELLAQEPLDRERIAHLTQEITAMWNQKLTRPARISWIISLIAAGVIAVPSGFVSALCMPDPFMRAIWWMFTASNVAFALLAAYILRRGSLNFLAMVSVGKVGSGLTFFIALLLVIRAIASPNLEAIAFAIFGLVWFVLAIAINLWNRIIQAELSTREQLLRLELRLMGNDPARPL